MTKNMNLPKVPKKIKKPSKSKEHAKFRRSSVWKKFRLSIIAERGPVCELSGLKRKKNLQLHHCDPEHYEDLDPSKFVLLTAAEHKNIERLLRIKDLDIDAYCERLKDIYRRSKSDKKNT